MFILKNHTPLFIINIESEWDFGNKYYDEFRLSMNGRKLDTNDIIGDLIEPFLDFY